MTNQIRILVAFLGIVALAAGTASAGDRDDNPRLAQAAESDAAPKKSVSTPADVEPAPAGAASEERRAYRVSLGPWSGEFSVPEWVDLLDVTDRIRGFFGMLAILGVAVFLSDNRRAISRRVVIWGLALQWGLAIFVLRVPAGARLFAKAGKVIEQILDCAIYGARFVFGKELVNPDGPAGFVFAFRILPTVIFVAALFAVLYHLGVMQWVVRGFAVVMAKLMGTSGAESLNVAASLFLGQTEAPLTIRPYLARLTRSELLTVMTSGMAHVSGGVMAAYISYGIEARHILTAVIMTAPGSILLSKILVPETERPETYGSVGNAEGTADANVLDAAARGTRDGLHLALNIAAVLISFLALVELVNLGLGYLGPSLQGVVGWVMSLLGFRPPAPIHLSLQGIVGWVMAPIAYMLGVAWEDCKAVGELLGTRTVLNELFAFSDLGALKRNGILIDRSVVISSFALCGFANISSIGIQLGGIGALVPERRHDLARLGLRALFAGTMANYLSACIAGILL